MKRTTRTKIPSICAVSRDREEQVEWARREAAKDRNEERMKIEQMEFRELGDALQSGDGSIKVNYGLAVKAHEKTNSLIIKKSLDDAGEVDEKANDPAYKKPPLFGMPISIKESIEVDGERCTWELVILKEDSNYAMKLRIAGYEVVRFSPDVIMGDHLRHHLHGWRKETSSDAQKGVSLACAGTAERKGRNVHHHKGSDQSSLLVQQMKDDGIYLLLCPATVSPAMNHPLPRDTILRDVADDLLQLHGLPSWSSHDGKLTEDRGGADGIEQMDFEELKEVPPSGDYTAENSMSVDCGLTVRINKKSLDDARELEEKASDPDYKKPPRPISIKESIEVDEERCTWGFVRRSDCCSKDDFYDVMKLRRDGILHCQSTIPITCMTHNCNSIYASTSYPFSSSRSSGGSSGDEEVLIGMGSDLGGAIRIPAAFSDCSGFKPSTRFATLQMPEPGLVRPLCMPTEGTRDGSSHSRVVMSAPINFREELFTKGTKYPGYCTCDDFIDRLPGNQGFAREREAMELLRAQDTRWCHFAFARSRTRRRRDEGTNGGQSSWTEDRDKRFSIEPVSK